MKKILFLVVIIQLSAISAYSQKKLWTLKACIDTAIKNNLTSSTLEKQITTANSKVSPSPSFKVTNPDGISDLQSVSEASIYSLGNSKLAANSITLLMNKERLNSLPQELAQKEITFQVLNQYLKVLIDLEQINIFNQHLQESKARLKEAELLVRQGKKHRSELRQIETQLGNDKMSLISTIGDLSNDQIIMMELMGIPLDLDFEIEKSIVSDIRVSQKSIVFQNTPIDDTKSSLTSSSEQLKSSQHLEQIKKAALRKEIEQVYEKYHLAEKQFEHSNEKFLSADKTYKDIQNEFQSGLVTAMDLEIEKNNYLSAQAELLQAKYELIYSKEALDYYNKDEKKL